MLPPEVCGLLTKRVTWWFRTQQAGFCSTKPSSRRRILKWHFRMHFDHGCLCYVCCADDELGTLPSLFTSQCSARFIQRVMWKRLKDRQVNCSSKRACRRNLLLSQDWRKSAVRFTIECLMKIMLLFEIVKKGEWRANDSIHSSQI